MVVDAKAVFISWEIFTRAVPALSVTLSEVTGAVFSFLVAAATRRSCLHVYVLLIVMGLEYDEIGGLDSDRYVLLYVCQPPCQELYVYMMAI
jgi:hypothetical protein